MSYLLTFEFPQPSSSSLVLINGDSWILISLTQRLCALCGKFYSLLCLSVCLSLRPYLPAFFTLLSIRLEAPCISGNAPLLSCTPSALLVSLSLSFWVALSLMSGCVPLYLLAEGQIELPCAESFLFPINCGWAACSGLGAC